MTGTKVLLALLSLIAVILATPGALAAPAAKSAPAKKATDNNNQISMVMEPQGNQLKIFLTSKTDLDLKDAVVEASYFVGGQQKTLIVQRQTDSKNRKPFYLIDKFDSSMTNLKVNVKVGQYAQSFNLPDMK